MMYFRMFYDNFMSISRNVLPQIHFLTVSIVRILHGHLKEIFHCDVILTTSSCFARGSKTYIGCKTEFCPAGAGKTYE